MLSVRLAARAGRKSKMAERDDKSSIDWSFHACTVATLAYEARNTGVRGPRVAADGSRTFVGIRTT
jgi:hypothetical protein